MFLIFVIFQPQNVYRFWYGVDSVAFGENGLHPISYFRPVTAVAWPKHKLKSCYFNQSPNNFSSPPHRSDTMRTLQNCVVNDESRDGGLGNYKLGLKCFAVEPGSICVISTSPCFTVISLKATGIAMVGCQNPVPFYAGVGIMDKEGEGATIESWVSKTRQVFIRQPDHKRVRVSLNLASCVNTPACTYTQVPFYSGFELISSTLWL